MQVAKCDITKTVNVTNVKLLYYIQITNQDLTCQLSKEKINCMGRLKRGTVTFCVIFFILRKLVRSIVKCLLK